MELDLGQLYMEAITLWWAPKRGGPTPKRMVHGRLAQFTQEVPMPQPMPHWEQPLGGLGLVAGIGRGIADDIKDHLNESDEEKGTAEVSESSGPGAMGAGHNPAGPPGSW